MMNHLNESYAKLAKHFDSLTMRERGMVLLGSIVMLYILWTNLVFDKVSLQGEEISRGIQQSQVDLKMMESEIKGLAHQINADPNADIYGQMDEVNREIASFQKQTKDATKALISPNQMVRVLEDLLTREEGLRLVSLDTKGSKPLGLTPAEDTKAQDTKKTQKAKLFSHSFSVEFQGDYLTTLKYLSALESLPWKFFWDAVNFEVTEYPNAKVQIDLHTLGLTEGWIGV